LSPALADTWSVSLGPDRREGMPTGASWIAAEAGGNTSASPAATALLDT
jgi:hypothetical protein